MITIYGRVTEIEATVPPPPEAPPPEIPVEEGGAVLTQFERDLRDSVPNYRAVVVVPASASTREGEEPAKTWVHVHVVLDSPHAGELTVECPETQVSGMLMVGGRARIMLASN